MTDKTSDLVTALKELGFPPNAAVSLTYIYVYGYARPQAELSSILVRHPGLESQDAAREAISYLLRAEALKITRLNGLHIVEFNPAGLRPDVARVINRFGNLRKAPGELNLTVVGSPGEGRAYSSFLEILASASRSIDLWTASSASYDDALQIVSQRAGAGVNIRVLLASPSAVKSVRGAAAESTARKTIDAWRSVAQISPNLEIRIFDNPKDFILTGSAYIDKKSLRLTVFESTRGRGTDGVLVEIINPADAELNICRIFSERYTECWNRARSIGPLGWPKAILRIIEPEYIVYIVAGILYIFGRSYGPFQSHIDVINGVAGTALAFFVAKLLFLFGVGRR